MMDPRPNIPTSRHRRSTTTQFHWFLPKICEYRFQHQQWDGRNQLKISIRIFLFNPALLTVHVQSDRCNANSDHITVAQWSQINLAGSGRKAARQILSECAARNVSGYGGLLPRLSQGFSQVNLPLCLVYNRQSSHWCSQGDLGICSDTFGIISIYNSSCY